jgi:thiosulfate/3-mercaptopyruvate sulfurtransferase
MIFSTETIEKGIGQEGFVLVDAREPVRFRGETEPIDPVAGHIPGAVNIPFMGSLDESNRFLPPELLRRRFEIAKHATHPAMMCGSGVTACHNVLAYEIAYGQRPPLYAGSWSEWIADRSRPVATGP